MTVAFYDEKDGIQSFNFAPDFGLELDRNLIGKTEIDLELRRLGDRRLQAKDICEVKLEQIKKKIQQ